MSIHKEHMFPIGDNNNVRAKPVVSPQPGDLEALIIRIDQTIASILSFKGNPRFDSNPFALLSDYKQALTKDMALFSDVFNKNGHLLQSISCGDKKKIHILVDYFSKPLFPFYNSEDANQLQSAFRRISRSLLLKKETGGSAILIPSRFYGTTKTLRPKNAHKEELLEPEQKSMKANFERYLRDRHGMQLSSIENEVASYFEGRLNLEDLPIDRKTGRAYLQAVKVFDLAVSSLNKNSSNKWAFTGSSEVIRTKILQVCSPAMTTCEAYTKTLNPKKYKNRTFLADPYNWIPERVGKHQKMIANQTVLAAALSHRLNHFKPSIWLVRANTAAGKSTFLAKDPLFHQAEDENGERPGILNVDLFKYGMKRLHPLGEAFLVNTQVHEEGAALFSVFKSGLLKDAVNSSLLMEGRFSAPEEFESVILNFSASRNGEVLLLDIEAPLISSLNRVLVRDPFGIDPCPTLADIIKGYKESISYRKRFLEMVRKKTQIKYFKLYHKDPAGLQRLVVEKVDDKFQVYSPELLNVCCKVPDSMEIDRLLNEPITAQYVEEALLRGDIAAESRPLLACWQGVSIGKAVELHALGIPPDKAAQAVSSETAWRQKYGEIALKPFDGEWLQDLPWLVKHVESEHLLHVRGVDEDGKGLHWQADKFRWRLDPQFNPEAKIEGSAKGGFQTKIGYFVLPEVHVSALMAGLSPKILRELEVVDFSGTCIGYRFFVHPTAYGHFKSLHDAGIPFVKPEHSEFMGTPTSSYRSWVVRKVKKDGMEIKPSSDAVPFIVKLGVANGAHETSKLLSRDQIEKSLQAQRKIDSLDRNCFQYGEGGCNFSLFPERCGLIPKDIPHYPPRAESGSGEKIESGIIIREFPEEFLEGKWQILSFSALMSLERSRAEDQGICSTGNERDLTRFPLIYEVIQASIAKGCVKNTEEFIRRYLIKGYLEAIEGIYFREGIAFSPHGQNLCLVLNKDDTVRGFSYRDLEGISAKKYSGYLETFSWFYKYHVFIKLLTVLTNLDSDFLAYIPGHPSQAGSGEKLPERNLLSYLSHALSKQPAAFSRLLVNALTEGQFYSLLQELDDKYLALLSKYFDAEGAQILGEDGSIPAAEEGSPDETEMERLNKKLWKHRDASGTAGKKEMQAGWKPSDAAGFKLNVEPSQANSYQLEKEIRKIRYWEKGMRYEEIQKARRSRNAEARVKNKAAGIGKEKWNLLDISKFEKEQLFRIGIHSTSGELRDLLNAGLDPHAVIESKRPTFMWDGVQLYRPEVNLLDLAVMEAEKIAVLDGFSQEAFDAIEKVKLLIERGADPHACHHECDQNYLFRVSDPRLVRLFCQAGVDVKAEALLDSHSKLKVRPIELTCDLQVIEDLCTHGENRENSPFLKRTKAHEAALSRIGYKSELGPAQTDKEGVPFLIKAVKNKDLPAVIALIGEGVDFNQTSKTGAWTALHWLFSAVNHGSVSEQYDYLTFARDLRLRMINLLIRQGAQPVKDNALRTPLMCLTFHAFALRFNRRIIDCYAPFEARHFHMDAVDYRKKFDELREGGFRTATDILGMSLSNPIHSSFEDFWESLKERSHFMPDVSHHPIAEWNKMKEFLEGPYD